MLTSATQHPPGRKKQGWRLPRTPSTELPPGKTSTWRAIAVPGDETLATELARLIDGGLPSASIVKQGDHRAVYRLELPGRVLFVKHYPARTWRKWLAQRFRPSAARREWNKTQQAAQRGVPTVALAACLERTFLGLTTDSFLISAEVPDALPLNQYLGETLPNLSADRAQVARRRLLRLLARFAAQIHQAGLDHDDFHAGNVLIQGSASLSHCPTVSDQQPRAEDSVRPRLVLIDLPGARLGPPLGWRRTRRSLAMLGTSLWSAATATERRRFFAAYLKARPELAVPPPAAADQLHESIRAHSRRILRGRDDRALRTNRDFLALSRFGGTAHAVRDIAPSTVAALLADPDAPLRIDRHSSIKLSHTSVVVVSDMPLSLPDGAGRSWITVAYKRSRPATWWKKCLAWFRQGRAIEAFRRGHALLQRGIPTPRPLLALASRRAARRGDSHLAVEWIDGAKNLHLLCWRLADGASDQRRRRTRQAADALGQLLGRMHDQRVAHRDLKGTNLLLVERPDGVAALLVDLDGMSIRRWLSRRRQVDDLARLAVSVGLHDWISRTDRWRFLRAYQQEWQGKPHDLKQFWRAVARRSAAIQARMARRGSPLA